MQLSQDVIIQSRYRLVSLKGRGSFGEVWLAKDEQTDLDVAVKVYIALDDRGLEEFKAEYKNSFMLNHPNLLHAYYFDVVDRQPFLVMPYCPDSAESLVGNTDEKTLLRFIRDVASGLEYLHARDIIHRDIKPDNILVNQEGNFVVTDFGVSSKMKSTLRRNSTRAMAGADVAGTIGYMAPELFSRNPDAVKATDIWALGATVFEMASGEMPFFGQGGALLLRGADIPELRGEWSEGFRNLVDACLAKETWDRPTAARLVEMADSLLKGRPVAFKGPSRLVDTFATVRNSTAEPQVAPVVSPDNKPAPSTNAVVGKVKVDKNNSAWYYVAAAIILISVFGLVMTRKSATDSDGSQKAKVEQPTPEAKVNLPSGNKAYYGTVFMKKDGSRVRIKRIEFNFDSGIGKSYYSDKPLDLRFVEKKVGGPYVYLKIQESNPDMTIVSKLGEKITSIYEGFYSPKDKTIAGKGQNWHGEEFTFIFSQGKAPWIEEETPEKVEPSTEKKDASPVKEAVKTATVQERRESEKVAPKPNTTVITSSAKISRTSIEIKVGETYQLAVSGGSGSAHWVSEGESIATVNDSGLVTGIKAGTTKVSVMYDGIILSCSVVVKQGSNTVPSPSSSSTDRTIYSKETTIKVGERVSAQLSEGKVDEWEVNQNVSQYVSATSNGTLTALKAGRVGIWGYIGGSPKLFKLTIVGSGTYVPQDRAPYQVSSKDFTMYIGDVITAKIVDGDIASWEIAERDKTYVVADGNRLCAKKAGSVMVWGYVGSSPKRFNITIK